MRAVWAGVLRHYAAERERRHGFLWTPVLLGAGITVYLTLPREPAAWAVHGVALIAATLAVRRYLRGMPAGLLAIAALLLTGMSLGKARVDVLAAPMLSGPVTTALAGRVVAVDVRDGRRPRIVLDRVTADAVEPSNMPARVRISLAPNAVPPAAGARIALLARLDAVPGPAAPGDFDPRRAAFFDRIGGSGFALGELRIAETPRHFGPRVAIANLRAAIVERLRAALPGEAGAVAAALLVGERGYLSRDVVANLRDSGLAHILAISGLHMGLVAGTVFAAVRAALALSPTLALTRPLRKWAAVAALAAGLFYLAISGGNVATIRAFVMVSILFTAILMDRPALSLRNLAIAAILVLAVAPENIAEPGFQMSFTAAAALVAAWEWWRRRADDPLRGQELRPSGPTGAGVRLIVGGLAAILATTLIASLATAPIAAYHFQRLATFSLVGNMLAMPLVSLIVMPSGLAALLAMPFGLEVWPLAVFGWGADRLLDVAAFTAGLPHAVRPVPALPAAFLVLSLGGLMWLCLWHTAIRFLGAVSLAAALTVAAVSPAPPDLLVDAGGRTIAARTAAGAYIVSGGRAGSYTLERWHRLAGLAVPDRVDRTGVTCDGLGCILRTGAGQGDIGTARADGGNPATGDPARAGERLVAHVRDPLALAEDCRVAAIVVTPLIVSGSCPASLVIDGTALAVRGAHAVRFRADGEADTNESASAGTLFDVTTAYPAVRRPWHGPGARP